MRVSDHTRHYIERGERVLAEYVEILGKLHLHCSRNSEAKQQSLDQEENDFCTSN
jgi:hypothetical protein